jgi:predicted ribosome quality control (RQC) complex YloA/Tae2 family protein
MPFDRLRFAVVTLTSLFAAGSLLAQEALDAEKSPKPAEEASSETAKPEATPEKTAKKQAASDKPAKSIEETMRPEEFKAAGLDKLSEDELQHLDAYLQGYRQATQKKAAEQAQAKAQDEIKKANEKAEKAEQATEEANRNAANARTKLDSLVSRVDGNIEGIKGHTVIRLEDGTVWKQVNVDDHYRATVTDRPVAVVLHTTFGYKMRIEGMPEFYVDPVVRP